MTTTVKVQAHCDGNTTGVKVSKTGHPDVYLKDGEETEVHCHDNILVRVQELPLDQCSFQEDEVTGDGSGEQLPDADDTEKDSGGEATQED